MTSHCSSVFECAGAVAVIMLSASIEMKRRNRRNKKKKKEKEEATRAHWRTTVTATSSNSSHTIRLIQFNVFFFCFVSLFSFCTFLFRLFNIFKEKVQFEVMSPAKNTYFKHWTVSRRTNPPSIRHWIAYLRQIFVFAHVLKDFSMIFPLKMPNRSIRVHLSFWIHKSALEMLGTVHRTH